MKNERKQAFFKEKAHIVFKFFQKRWKVWANPEQSEAWANENQVSGAKIQAKSSESWAIAKHERWIKRTESQKCGAFVRLSSKVKQNAKHFVLLKQNVFICEANLAPPAQRRLFKKNSIFLDQIENQSRYNYRGYVVAPIAGAIAPVKQSPTTIAAIAAIGATASVAPIVGATCSPNIRCYNSCHYYRGY